MSARPKSHHPTLQSSRVTSLYKGAGKYELIYHKVCDPVNPKDFKNKQEIIQHLTQAWSTALEREIRQDPGQYFWLHRRWKSQPRVIEKKPEDS